MDKKEFLRQRQQILDECYRKDPEVAVWVRTKRILWRITAGYFILHMVLDILLRMQMQTYEGLGREIFKLLFQLFWLFISINPERSWRISTLLYLFAVVNFSMLFLSGESMLNSLPYISAMPLLGAIMFMELLLPLLLLALAIYLTAFPKSRELSERAWEICKKSMEGYNDTMNI